MDLQGKVAFVTGGSGDIGTGIAAALARAGADVAVSYVGHREGAERTAALVEAEKVRSLIVPLDQRDPASIDASVDAVIDGLGRVDMLINNAGWNIGIPFTNIDALTADDLESRARDQPARAVSALARVRPAPPRPRRRPHRQHRLGRRASAVEQQHRLLGQQGRADSPHALPGGRAGAHHHRELRGARTRRRHAHRAPFARSGRRRRATTGGSRPHRQHRRHRRTGRHVLPCRFGHRSDARGRRGHAGGDALNLVPRSSFPSSSCGAPCGVPVLRAVPGASCRVRRALCLVRPSCGVLVLVRVPVPVPCARVPA